MSETADGDPTEFRDCPVAEGCSRYRHQANVELQHHQEVMSKLDAIERRLDWDEAMSETTMAETVKARAQQHVLDARQTLTEQQMAQVRSEGRRAAFAPAAIVAAVITAVGVVGGAYIQAHPAHASPAASR